MVVDFPVKYKNAPNTFHYLQVFQRRENGYCYRKWNDYKNGFGNPKSEFWLGECTVFFYCHKKNQNSNLIGQESYYSCSHMSAYPDIQKMFRCSDNSPD